jgi:hypothetical protein
VLGPAASWLAGAGGGASEDGIRPNSDIRVSVRRWCSLTRSGIASAVEIEADE